MGHSRVRAKVRRRKVAILAAKSKQFDVINHKQKMPTKVEHKRYYDGDIKNAITCPFTGHKFIPTNPHPVPGKFGITITGYDWVEPEGKLWVIPDGGFKQPKRLVKFKKRKYGKKHETTNGVGGIMMVQNTKPGKQKRNDFKQFKNYPYHLPKMNHVEYMEALVEHKTEKWERKNPQPMNMFTEDVEKWKQTRETAIERIRDFVVSVYDKLILTGRFKTSENKYNEEKIAEIKDINGEGHHVNDLNKDSKLLKKAQKEVNKTHAKRPNLVAGNLRDHKKQKGRIILPQAA
jgi:hypothetical protein